MYVDANTIILIGAVFGVLSALGAALYKFFKWLNNQTLQDEKLAELKKQHEEDIEGIKKEQCMICYALLATLDGLKQLGANGNVTDAYNKLEKHINKAAHE